MIRECRYFLHVSLLTSNEAATKEFIFLRGKYSFFKQDNLVKEAVSLHKKLKSEERLCESDSFLWCSKQPQVIFFLFKWSFIPYREQSFMFLWNRTEKWVPLSYWRLRILVKILSVLCCVCIKVLNSKPTGAFPTDICLSHGTCLKIYALMSSLQSQVFFSVPPVVSGTKFSKLVKFTAADKARILVYIGCCMDV